MLVEQPCSPPSLSFFKVNFNSNVLEGDQHDDLDFVIKGAYSGLVAVGDTQVFDTLLPGVELRAALAGIIYKR